MSPPDPISGRSGRRPRPAEPFDPDLDPSDPAQPHAAGTPAPPWSWRQRARPDTLASVAIGGAVGAGARDWISTAWPAGPAAFPWATLWINLSGGFLLGLGLVLIIERLRPGRHLRPLFATGFCGGFTTFSTLAVQSDLLVHRGRLGLALAYLAGSTVAGLGATVLGMAIARLSPTRSWT